MARKLILFSPLLLLILASSERLKDFLGSPLKTVCVCGWVGVRKADYECHRERERNWAPICISGSFLFSLSQELSPHFLPQCRLCGLHGHGGAWPEGASSPRALSLSRFYEFVRDLGVIWQILSLFN